MCAGITFFLDKIDEQELSRFLTPEEFAKQKRGKLLETFYWQKRPFLPVMEDGEVHLLDWGNREATLKMPKTGWAKLESVRDGLWDYLHPKQVIIPSLQGYEKRKWFKTPQGIKGIRVRYHNVMRVYLLTTKADQAFREYTKHDRMPVGLISYL